MSVAEVDPMTDGTSPAPSPGVPPAVSSASSWEAGRPVRPTSHTRRLVAVLALLMLVGGILMARGWRPGDGGAAANGQATTPRSAAIEDAFGIRITGIDLTAAGGMIQIRYQVLDPDKVDAIHDEDSAPVVVGADGHVYADPGIAGHTHIARVGGAGSSDTILLANARGGVTRGSVVSVKVGDLRLDGIHVG